MDGIAMTPNIKRLALELAQEIERLPEVEEKVEALNGARQLLHDVSPFKAEPVDFVKWVPAESLASNDYNPNKVATPEMDLLYKSIKSDGYTQPVVAFPLSSDLSAIVDGFHRFSTGVRRKDINTRVHGYLPVTHIDKPLHERMASTIRHNRARGKHQVELMSTLVVRMHNEGQTDIEIAKALGMTADELIRLKAQTGIAALYANEPYSRSWVTADDEA
jgi:ParB-like chromosome segregation protein Spo0J